MKRSLLIGVSFLAALFGISGVAGPFSSAGELRSSGAAAEGDSIRVLSLKSNDILFNPVDSKLYASVPSSAGGGGNSIVAVDPMTGISGAPVWVGSEPSKLALANDGHSVYVYLSGAYAIQRFDFLTQTAGARFSLGQESFHGLYQANDFAVAPDNPDLIAVARYYLGTSPPQGGAAVFQNGVRLPATGPGHSEGLHFLTFGSSGSTLYGSNDYGLKTMAVSGSGLVVQNGVVSAGQYSRLKFQNGLIFTSSGQMIDAGAGNLVGTFPLAASPAFVPDTAVGRAYYLVKTNAPTNTWTLRAYGLSTFTEIGSLQISNVIGDATSLVRWGTNGLAFRTTGDQLFLIQTSLIPTADPLPSPPAVPTPTPSPTPHYLPSFVRKISLPANDVVYSRQTNSVLISVPGASGAGVGNTITHITPSTGEITGSYFIGSEPKRLAISDDGQTLYAVLSGANAIRRYDVAARTPGIQFATSSLFFNPPDLAVMPDNPDLLAVAVGYDGVGVFDNGVQRPLVSDGGAYAINSIAVSDTPNVLYGYDLQSSGFELVKFNITEQGVAGTLIGNNLLSGYSTKIAFSDGLLYATSGRVIDPETKAISGTYQGSGSALAIDSPANRVYVLNGSDLSVFDQKNFIKIGSASIPFTGTPATLVRWGANGLIVRTTDNNVFLIQSALVSSDMSVPTGTAMAVANHSASESAATVTVAVNRTGDLSRASTVNFETANGSAIGGADFVPQTGTLNFAAWETSKNITIQLINDATFEPNESFAVRLTDPGEENVQLLSPTTTNVAILNDDNRPRISMAGMSIGEPGIGDTVVAEIPVILSNASHEVVSVNYSTANGTAAAGSDYVAKSGTLTFQPFETTKSVPVTLLPDGLVEETETFFLNISGPVNSTIIQSQTSVLILDFIHGRQVPSDFDGDGKSDYSVFRPSDGTWYLALSLYGTMYVQPWGVAMDEIVPADYDGDGITDMAVYRPNEGKWYVIYSQSATLNAIQFGLEGDIPMSQDFDGDRKSDFGIWRPSDGTWYLGLSASGSMYVLPFGQNGDKPVPADYDNDGKTDLAVWRPNEGRWYVGSIATGAFSTYDWGLSGDIPVAGDFSGDGKADYAVYRPSDQTWYRVHTDTFAVVEKQFGAAGDIPAPGDFDGDGKLDISLFRPTEGRWYVWTATNTPLSQLFGLNGDIPTESAYIY